MIRVHFDNFHSLDVPVEGDIEEVTEELAELWADRSIQCLVIKGEDQNIIVHKDRILHIEVVEDDDV